MEDTTLTAICDIRPERMEPYPELVSYTHLVSLFAVDAGEVRVRRKAAGQLLFHFIIMRLSLIHILLIFMSDSI